MYLYKKTVYRSTLMMLTLTGIILGWLLPSVSCACPKTIQAINPIGQKSEKIEPLCCLTCIKSQNCSCCTIHENLFDLNAKSINEKDCSCGLLTKNSIKSTLPLSNILNERYFKPQLKNPKTSPLVNSTNQLIFEKYGNDFYFTKVKSGFNLMHKHHK
jgi:hypothetical protein